MDTDAYGGFVTVDVEAISCLFRVGIIGGTQYADIADDVLSRPPKYFRHALECLKRAVEYFRSRGVTVVAHLGDVLAAENADGGSQWTALQSFNDARGKLPTAAWHVAPGVCDASCFGPDGAGLGAIFGAPQTGRSYYSFFPTSGWRVLVLDSTDPTGGFSAASTSASVPEGAPLGGSGSLGPAQLTWLNAQLSVASAEGERVLVMLNRGVRGAHALVNADAVHERLSAYPGTVAAVLSLGDGAGHYEKDSQGVHHISPLRVVGRDLNEDAFGCLEVYDDKLKLEMIGEQLVTGTEPEGWPSELPLPRGGQLVTGADAQAFSFFLSFLFFMINFISTPLQPVFRMLTSNEPPPEDDDGAAVVEAGEAPEDGAHAVATVVPVAAPVAPSGTDGGGGVAESTESGAPATDEPGVVV